MKPASDAGTPERLQKILSRAGVASRRAAEELIAQRAEDLAGFSMRFQSELIAIDPSLEGLIGDKPASLVFVEARADVSDPRNRANVAAVVNLASDEFEGPKIIRWFDRAPWRGTLPTGNFGAPAS